MKNNRKIPNRRLIYSKSQERQVTFHYFIYKFIVFKTKVLKLCIATHLNSNSELQQQDESAQAEIPEITVNKQEIIVEAQEPQAPNLDPAKESIKDSIKNSIEQESRSRKRYSVNAKLYNNESRK